MSEKNTKYIDHLTEDNPISSQKWVCMSFLSPEGIKNCSVRGIKIRGVYADREDADNRAKELQELDPDFNVFVGEVGKWLPWDPDPNDENCVKDQQYREKQLNDLMVGYKNNLRTSRKMQEERKRDMIEKAASEEQNRAIKAKARAKKTLAKRRHQKRIDNIAKQQVEKQSEKQSEKQLEIDSKIKELENKENDTKTNLKKLQEIQKSIDKETESVKTIDEKLKQAKELYNNFSKKKMDS